MESDDGFQVEPLNVDHASRKVWLVKVRLRKCFRYRMAFFTEILPSDFFAAQFAPHAHAPDRSRRFLISWRNNGVKYATRL
jgi:hypothetical protein